MLWLQVTPAHTDPHHNLLAQVRGRKYVRLYRPDDLPALYPFASGLTTNSSQVHLAWLLPPEAGLCLALKLCPQLYS